jgi:LysM repeat protein
MRLRRYRGRHLKRRPVRRGPVVIGTATTVWMAGSHAHAATHVVKPGETLTSIARRYGTTVQRLAAANNLSDPNFIATGQSLRVPFAATLSGTHTVQSGETLSSIAARYGTPLRALARVNRIADPNLIVAGSTLRVPGGGSTSSVSGTPDSSGTHTVRPGETLWGIAARYGTTVDALARANGISNPSLIVSGSSLSVPGGGGAVVASLPAAPQTSVQASLERHAADQGVDTSLVKAVAWQESGWQQDVVSSSGAIGVMQVMPGTARYVNQVLGQGNLNVRETDDNVQLGVRYLKHMLDSMPSEEHALAAYYSGPGNVGGRLQAYQRHYVRAVLSHRNNFR